MRLALLTFILAVAPTAVRAQAALPAPACASGAGAGLEADESLLLFPTFGFREPGTNSWQVSVRGWIFEPEQNSRLRRGLIDALADELEVEPGTEAHSTFVSRTRLFLADNEGGKRVDVHSRFARVRTPRSGSDGLFTVRLTLDPRDPQTGAARVALAAELDCRRAPSRIEVPLVSDEGVSVISDVDDTIKISEVLDRKRLLRRTFIEPFEAVPGMPEALGAIAAGGASFHYVSGSPWPLLPSLGSFVAAHYPAGSMHLRKARLADGSLFDLLKGTAPHKHQAINELLTRLPQRRFVLIGDSGEQDPEIYGAVARAHPGRIALIAIRRVAGAANAPERFEAALRGMPATRRLVFDDPRELVAAVESSVLP